MNSLTHAKGISYKYTIPYQTVARMLHDISVKSVATDRFCIARCNSTLEDKIEKKKKREIATFIEPAQTSWITPSSNFFPDSERGRPPGGSSPVIQFFRDRSGDHWVGKCGPLGLFDRDLLLRDVHEKTDFICPYVDEILEKLGLEIYDLLGTKVPESVLSYQPITAWGLSEDYYLILKLEAQEKGSDFELPQTPTVHLMVKYVEGFQKLEGDFIEYYISQAKNCGNEYVKIRTAAGEFLPLKGLGSMLAVADFLYDLDCLGDYCGNAGYIVQENEIEGRYAQLVKIDAGYAFSYSMLRFETEIEKRHNPRDRAVVVAPNKMRLEYANLAPADQQEFAAAAKRVLSIPYEKLMNLFSQTERMDFGVPTERWQDLLNGLVARKGLFLKAFAPETDRAIINEIETAQAKIASTLEASEEVSAQTVEKLLMHEREEAEALAELRVRLAVVDVEQSEPKKLGECNTFQLPHASTHFIGREEALITLVKQLGQAGTSVIGQSISGIGGVGKTQLALHYAQAAAKGEAIAGCYLNYEYVIWINAEMFIEGQFQALAELYLGKQLEVEKAIEALYAFLIGKRTLIVFDNTLNALDIWAFLPPPGYASPLHLLITSRNPQWGEMPVIKLGGFNIDEACEYVKYHLGPQTREAIVTLMNLVDGLPLAMSQAISYIKAGHCSLETFEEQFYLNQANLLSHELIEDESHPKTVGTTLTLALAQAKIQSGLAERLMGIMAYLEAENIQIELLVQILNSPRQEIEQCINVLENYSLINRIGNENVQVHRLVQEVMRHRHKFLAQPKSYWENVLTFLNEKMLYDTDNLDDIKSCSYLISHVGQLSIISEGQCLDKSQDLMLSNLLSKAGLNQQKMGNYVMARDFYSRALAIRMEHCASDEIFIAETLSTLGNACGLLGDYRTQKKLQKYALAIEEAHYGPNHLTIAKTLNNLGAAYNALGKPHKEKKLLERALSILEIHGWPDDAILGTVLGNLGNAYGAMGDERAKKEFLERALRIEESIYGSDHPKVAGTLANLSSAYGNLRERSKKIELAERALAIFEKHYGTDHPHVVRVLAMLAETYEYDKRKECLERIFRIEELYYGANHPEVARTLLSLGYACGALGDISKHLELAERACKNLEAYYGPDHPEIIPALSNLSDAYIARGDLVMAKKFLERALKIGLNCYGEHPKIAFILRELSEVCTRQFLFWEAEEYAKRADKILKAQYGDEHPTNEAKDFVLSQKQLAVESVMNDFRDWNKSPWERLLDSVFKRKSEPFRTEESGEKEEPSEKKSSSSGNRLDQNCIIS